MRPQLRIIRGGLADCTHRNVERRIEHREDAESVMVWDYEYCLDCKTVVPPPIYRVTEAGLVAI